MDNSTDWEIAVVGGLDAHFKQPEWSSRSATEWAISIRSGNDEHRVLVRSYHHDHAGLTQQQLIAHASLRFDQGLALGVSKAHHMDRACKRSRRRSGLPMVCNRLF